jgi:ribosomal protein L1
MDKKLVEKVVHELRKEEYKKKFAQSFDVIINLKDINLKNLKSRWISSQPL